MHIRDAILNDIFGERISENISIDNNGQLICANCVLARTGYYDYLESELFDGGSDTKVIKVYRSPEEVFAPESIRSMNFKPLVDDHPEGNVTPDSVNSLSKGFMANVRRGDGEYSESLMGDLVVTDPEVIELIQTKNKRDLSVGYTCDIEEKDGKYFMKNIRGNHIALCKAGRAGNARIRDSRVVDAKPLDREGNVLSVGTKVFIYRGGNNEGKVGTVKTIKNVSEYGSDFEVEYNGVVTKHSSEDLIKDSKPVKDVVAKGSFVGIEDLRSHFGGTGLVADGDRVVVDADGRQLEYKVLADTGRIVLVNDSSVGDSKGVDEVYSKFVDERDAVYKGLELTGAEDECSTKHAVKNDAFDTYKAAEEFKLGFKRGDRFRTPANNTLEVISVTPDGVRTKRDADGFIQFWKTFDFWIAFAVNFSAVRVSDSLSEKKKSVIADFRSRIRVGMHTLEIVDMVDDYNRQNSGSFLGYYTDGGYGRIYGMVVGFYKQGSMRVANYRDAFETPYISVIVDKDSKVQGVTVGDSARVSDADLSPANIKLSNGSIVNFYGWADKNGYGTSYYSVGEKTRSGFVFHAHFETESLAKRFLSSFNNPSAVVVRSAIGVTKSVVVDSHKRMFKVRVGDKEYGVRAYDHTDAVRKVRDSQRYIVYAPDTYNGRTALCYKRQGKAQYSEFSRADRFSK